MQKIVDRINALEETLDSTADLPQWTQTLRERASSGESLDALLPEAFAAVREAAKRAKGMRHYDVQLIGGSRCTRGASQKCALGKVRP